MRKNIVIFMESPGFMALSASVSFGYWALLEFGIVPLGRGVYEYDKRPLVLVGALFAASAIYRLAKQSAARQYRIWELEAELARLMSARPR